MAKPLREPSYLILVALADEPRYGYSIIQTVRELSDGRTNLGPGTLYGALDRLVAESLIEPDHDEVVDGRLRRYYRVTEDGRRVVSEETARLAALSARAAVQLRARPGGRAPDVAGLGGIAGAGA